MTAADRLMDDLQWRGLIAQSTDLGALREALDAGPVTFYCGFDPTAPSLHMGNLVQLILMRHLQRAGHHPIVLVGGSTGLIGDPKPTSERVLKSKEQTAEWVSRIAEQVRPFLDFEGDNPARLVNNLDWTAPISAIDFLRDIGKHFRVNTMIRKDAVAARLASDEGISYTEFSYQILQGLDYLHLFREYGCTLQTGAVDQWGNILAGVDLIHRVEQRGVHVLTTPIVTTADGRKFGKSEGNAVWLSPELTTPYAFYQFWVNVEDATVIDYLKIFTDRSREEIEALAAEVAERPAARLAQRTLAADVTALVHGPQAAIDAQAASQALFGRGSLTELDAATLAASLAELPRVSVVLGGEAAPLVAELFTDTGLASSRSAARRSIAEGGAYVNNERVTDEHATVGEQDLLAGRWMVLRRGKRNLAAVEAVPR